MTKATAERRVKSEASLIVALNHIELYVENSFQAAHFYRTALGFETVASVGLHTGLRDRSSIVMERGAIRLVLTAPLDPASPIGQHLREHGEGVKDISFAVRDLELLMKRANSHGPSEAEALRVNEASALRTAKMASCGALVHTLVEYQSQEQVWVCDSLPLLSPSPVETASVETVDHVALSVPAGQLEQWGRYYHDLFGLHQGHQEDVETQYSAMRSVVMENDTGTVRFPIVEPAPGRRKSQVQEYLDFNQGAGAQHIAFRCNDIEASIRRLMAAGLQFITVPSTYYDSLEDRVGPLGSRLSAIRELGILVDRDPYGRLLQAFTRPVGTRPTLFLELIERQGARGFGSGNIKALFEAVERAQAERGNL